MIRLGQRSAISETEKRHRRTNRKTYVVEILLVFAVCLAAGFIFDQLGLTERWVDFVLTALLLFLIGRAFAGRTHDIGQTDYWTLIPLAVFSAGWLVAVFWQEAPLWVEIVAHFAWALVLFAPLLFRGNEGENKFGSPPEDAIELKVIANVG